MNICQREKKNNPPKTENAPKHLTTANQLGTPKARPIASRLLQSIKNIEAFPGQVMGAHCRCSSNCIFLDELGRLDAMEIQIIDNLERFVPCIQAFHCCCHQLLHGHLILLLLRLTKPLTSKNSISPKCRAWLGEPCLNPFHE